MGPLSELLAMSFEFRDKGPRVRGAKLVFDEALQELADVCGFALLRLEIAVEEFGRPRGPPGFVP